MYVRKLINEDCVLCFSFFFFFLKKKQIYRVFPSGEVQYLHPKDGVYPEKVNQGRSPVNTNMRSIGKKKKYI